MKRIVFLDYIRVISCFLVILVHASENYYAAAGDGEMAGPVTLLANETDRLWVSLYDGISRLAVPLFMIVSAYLLVPMKEGMSATQFYRRRALRILPAFFIFMVLYSLLPMAWNQIDGATALNDFVRIPLNFPSLAGHLWFIYPLIGLYLFIPVISPWLANVSAKEERIFIWLFVISTCMPYLNALFGELWGECFWNHFHTLWYFSGYLGYLVLAHYIRVHLTWSRQTRLWAGTAMLIAGAIATIYSFYVQAIPGELIETPVLEIGWAFCTLNVVVLTTGAFLLFSCIRQVKAPDIITRTSKLSYGIYLMHIFWLGLWVGVFKGSMNLPTVAAIPVIAVVTFVCCWISCRLIAFIPGSKWLIGA